MSQEPNELEIQEALEHCASEQVHIPGSIQPFGYLIAYDTSNGCVNHVSKNCEALFGRPSRHVIGQHIYELLGPKIWHGLNNLVATARFTEGRHFVGLWNEEQVACAIYASSDQETVVVEIEEGGSAPSVSTESLANQAWLVDRIQKCETTEELFSHSVELLRHFTGFDRTMIYQFDAEWNGTVVAEARNKTQEPFLGLTFPHWDIPAQARAIMSKIPLRLISDVGHEPVAVLASEGVAQPLDMTFAQLRSVSPIHMQYLRNMGSQATMTLSIVIEGELWGIISFHHQSPRVSSVEIRQILVNGFLPIFCLKLSLLRQKDTLELAERVDELQAEIQNLLEDKTEMTTILDRIGPRICDTLNVQGITVFTGSQSHSHGVVATQDLVDVLITKTKEDGSHTFSSDDLANALPDHFEGAAGIFGAYVSLGREDRGVILFRTEIAHTISWAGNPKKTIESADGNSRLQPRGSFSRYLESVSGRSRPWTDNEQHLVSQLWPLLSAVERQSFMNDLSRQQMLMIGELNHRVRNILALIKSVSSQARRDGGSLESYSHALEARIQALAAAHDIGSGRALSAVPIFKIFELEANPFEESDASQFEISGENCRIKAEMAPIFALVVHELMTNALKYGSLSVPGGKVCVEVLPTEEGVTVSWREANGPEAVEPAKFGFGTTLIQQAVPYEMDGKASLEFDPNGLKAILEIPNSVLEPMNANDGEKTNSADQIIVDIPSNLKNGLVLIVEDNFMIATDLKAEIARIGYPNSETFSKAEDAARYIQSEKPALALLDFNLGRGRTSEQLAIELNKNGVPTIFITGHGEQVILDPALNNCPILTKPVSQEELLSCLAKLKIH